MPTEAAPATVAPAARARARRVTRRRWARRLRSWPSLVAIGVAVVLLVRLAFDAGGYFPAAFTSAGAIAFAALAVLAVAHVPHYRIGSDALVAVGALAALAAWTGLSSRWSAVPDAAVLDMQRAMLYVALFALGLLAAGSGRYARVLVWAMLAVIVVVAGAGLLSRLQPDLVTGHPEVPTLTDYRLAYPFGYWNAFGAMSAMGAVLALGLAADPRTWFGLRAVAAGASVLLGVAMYLSLSRGAWLALIIGLVALVALSAHRGSLLATAGLIAGAFVLAVTRLQSYPALIDDPAAGSGQEAQGAAYTGQLVVLVLIVVGVQAVVGAGRASPNLMQALRRVFRPILIGLAVLLALGVTGAYALRAVDAEGITAQALIDAEDWVDRQWQDFLAPATFSEGGTERLTTTRGTRSDIYRAAIDGFEAHPLRGDGAGAFEVRWMRTREVEEKVIDAHSLELEVLGELGAVGALLLLAFLGAVVTAAVRSRVRTGALPRAQAAAVGAACSVWLAHSFVDWDWQMPALTGTALVLAGALFAPGRRRASRREPSPYATVAG